jgi:large repetitive protein
MRVFRRIAIACALFASTAAAQDIAVTKSVDPPAQFTPGSDVPFNVFITNLGPGAANGVSLTDVIPAGMTFTSVAQLSGPTFTCTTPPPNTGGTVTCTIATLNAGAGASFIFLFRVPAAAVAGQEFQNTAVGASTPPDGNPQNDTSSATITVVANGADIAVTKTGPPIANAGQNVTYDVTISNAGPDTATSVTLTDAIPPGMTFVSFTQLTGLAFNCPVPAQPGDPIVCTQAAMLPGTSAQFQFEFQIDPQAAPGTSFTNVATGDSAETDPNEENNQGVAVTSTPPPPSADLGITKTAPSAAAANTNVPFTITVTNNGPDPAQNLAVTDVLPGDSTFVSLSQSGTTLNCTTPAVGAGGTVTCTALTYAALSTTTLTLTVHVPPATPSGTQYTNTATVVASASDPNEDNNIATATVTISAVDLSVTKTTPATANAGTNVTYTITVSNAGPDAAFFVELTDPLPAGTTLVSFNQTSGPAAACSAPAVGTNGTVVCNFEILGNLQSATFDLTINTGRSPATMTNTASVTTDSADTNPNNNSVTVMSAVTQLADLVVVKNGPATGTPGTNAAYTVSLTNNGPSVAMNVALNDATPVNTTFVSAAQNSGPLFACTTPGFGATGNINCTIPSLQPGASATFTFVFNISPGATSSITNTASAMSATTDPAGGNSSSSVTTFLTQSADLAVTKSGPPNAVAGNTVTYTVTATNSGPSFASTVTLSDNVPANTTFASNAQTSGPAFNCTTPAVGATGAITCTIASFPTGSPAVFAFTFNVLPGATGSVSNTATISAAADSIPGNNSSTAVTPLNQSANIGIAKSGPTTATAGTNVTYTVTASNLGPSAAANVTVTDNAPASTTFVSVTQTSGPTFNCTGVNCTIATFAAGATATFDYVFAVSSAATGTINNTATIASTTPDPVPGNNSASASTTVLQSADLSILKSGPAAITAGQNITYTVAASNAGPSSASNVTITDVLPANTTFVSATQTSGPAFNCTTPSAGAAGTITCTIATFAAGATASFNFVVQIAPAATGIISNTASISSTTADPTPGNAASGSAAVIDPGPTDVSIVKTASPTTAPQGDTATYTLTVTNNGPGTATGTTVTDVLPAGTMLLSVNTSQGTCSGTTTVICNVGILAPAANATIAILVRLPQTVGPLSNTATVTTANVETAPANNTSTAVLDIAAPIPTASEWGLMLMALMIAAVAVLRARQM